MTQGGGQFGVGDGWATSEGENALVVVGLGERVHNGGGAVFDVDQRGGFGGFGDDDKAPLCGPKHGYHSSSPRVRRWPVAGRW